LTLRRSNRAFILLLALPRNNDVDVISFVSFGVFVYFGRGVGQGVLRSERFAERRDAVFGENASSVLLRPRRCFWVMLKVR